VAISTSSTHFKLLPNFKTTPELVFITLPLLQKTNFNILKIPVAISPQLKQILM
jgi:hypothetical protein